MSTPPNPAEPRLPRSPSDLLAAGPDGAPALICDDGRTVTRGELRVSAARFAARLGPRKQLILIVADGSVDAIACYAAAFASGHAVMLVSDASEDFVRAVKQAYRPQWVFAAGQGAPDLQPHATESIDIHPDLGVLLSTSGSTGAVKFVRLSQGNVLANASSIAEYLAIAPADRGLLALPIHYSYGLSVLNSHLLAGAAVLTSRRTLTDPQLWRFFNDQRGTSFPGVPHSYKLLDAVHFEDMDLPSLHTMTQAGGRLPRESVLKYGELARRKGFKFFVMYGQTEATARIAFLPPEQVLTSPDCIGIPIPHGKLSLVDADGIEVTAADTEGELLYTGPNVMMGYANGVADLAAPAVASVLRTGDLGLRTTQGLYRITGRKSRFLKLFGLRISLDEIERKLEAESVKAVCTGDDERLVVLLTEAGHEAAVQQQVASMASVPASSVHVLHVEEFPLLPSGKTDYQEAKRSALARVDALAAGGGRPPAGALPGTGPATGAGAAQTATVLDLYADLFPSAAVDEGSTFTSLGGDSLTYVEASLALENLLGELPGDWMDLTAQELEARKVPKGGLVPVETSILLRAMAMVTIASGHFGLVGLTGGAYFLLALAGYNFSRFQLSQVLRIGSVKPIVSMAIRVAIPTLLVLWALSIKTGQFEPQQLVLLGNWVAARDQKFGYWFLELLPQIMLLLALLLSSARVRGVLKQRPYASALTLFAAGVASAVLVPQVWSVEHLYNRVPHMLFWMFALGWLIQQSRNLPQRALASCAVIVAPLIWGHLNPLTDSVPVWMLWMWIGCLSLVWIRQIRVPAVVSSVAHYVAGASIFIFLFHFEGRKLLHAVGLNVHPALDVMAGLATGVVIWLLWERGTRKLATLLRPLKARTPSGPR